MSSPPATWPGRLLAKPWLLAFVPVNAATAGFGVVLPLIILLPLHGTWGEVALAATIYNSAVIASSVVWGHLADRYPRRRWFLVINYGGYAALYALIALLPSINALYLLYAFIGLVAPAGASASTLLILEKFPEPQRATAYASFQEVSIIGSMVGLLLGFAWTADALALYTLLYVLGGLAGASAIAIWFSVREGERIARTTQVAHHIDSLTARTRQIPGLRISIPFFPVRPKFTRAAWNRFRGWVREEFTHEIPLVLAAIFLFNFAANLFNISLTPYLASIGLAASAIFLINFSNSAGQGLMYPLSGGLTARMGADRLVRYSTYIRALSYLATAGFAVALLVAPGAFGANLIAYGIAGGAIAFFTIASSLMLFRSLRGRDSGRVLGVNSALGGLAAVAGAGASGLLALANSYVLVFLVATGSLLVSLPVWAAATVAYERHHRHPEERIPPPPDPSRSKPFQPPRRRETMPEGSPPAKGD